MQSTYGPYLIHRVECHYDPDRPGMGALCSYDYMGAAEFEFGAVGNSNGRFRKAITAGVSHAIVKVPLNKPVVCADGNTHTEIFVLMGTEQFSNFGVGEFRHRVNLLLEGKLDTKERCEFDGAFAMWQDLVADIYFSYNATFLRLLYCIMARDPLFPKLAHRDISIGDTLTLAKVLNGRALHSVNRMETKTGTVVGILDNAVVIKDYKKYRMPFEYILTHEIKVMAPYEVAVK